MVMEKNMRMMIIGLLLLIVLTPLGLLATGETFGEWGLEELKEKIGYTPVGMERLSSLWSAPMPDYALPGTGGPVLGYVVSAIVGAAICAGVLYILGRKIARE
jgi:tetrahydromethanopterin S-methyltransferase subunit C